MENDYPAAHSMDTCFFAIDRDGHVAYFSSGEAGAVPVGAVPLEALSDPPEAADQQLAALPRVEVLHDPQGHILPSRANGIREHGGQGGSQYPILMFLDSLDPLREEIAAGHAVQVPASEGVAVVFRQLSEALAKRLHDSGACHGCYWHFINTDEEHGVADLATRGLFCYGHLTENWISGPYGRERQPARPIHVDQLPPNIRQAIKAVRFDSLCFAETPYIQPVEHAACESWEAAYVDAQYTMIRPIPGKEAEYAEAYDQLAEFAEEDKMNIAPPPRANEE